MNVDALSGPQGGPLNFSFAIQNVRSLNISTKNDITLQKIIAICNLGTDFILLSDLRLNSIKQISALNDILKKFFLKGYSFHHNSPSPSRGVGILIKKSVTDNNFSIMDSCHDDEGNFLALQINCNNTKFCLAAIYGPNHDDEINFFSNLSNILKDLNIPVIIGGDWNATLDKSKVSCNIDIVNMQNIPSFKRSNAINEICNNQSLISSFLYTFRAAKKSLTYL